MTDEMMPAVEPVAVAEPRAWDPFQLMDRLDEEALKRELEGVASADLVYVVKEGGQEVVGLSKTGVDECCLALVQHGQVIREEGLTYEIIGEGAEREALFTVKAARFAVSPAGQEVRLDQVIGVKRQALFFDARQLSPDAPVPGKKYRGRTYRELLATDDGRDYLAWMADNFGEPEVREFCRRLLAGEEISLERTRQLNPHWFEAGAMKAARNARFRLIPGNVKAQVIERARAGGQARVIEGRLGRADGSKVRPAAEQPERMRAPAEAAPVATERESAWSGEESPRRDAVASPARATGPYAPTEKQVAFYERLVQNPVFTEDERRRALEWLGAKATRQSIKDQIDWLKQQVEVRGGSRRSGVSAA